MMDEMMNMGVFDDPENVDMDMLMELGIPMEQMGAMVQAAMAEAAPDNSFYVMPPFAENIAANMFVNMDPTSGAGDGRMLIGRNEDPRKMFTFFVDAEERKDPVSKRCATDGSQFWVKFNSTMEFVRLKSIDGVEWGCLSRMSPKQPEEFTALDIMVGGN